MDPRWISVESIGLLEHRYYDGQSNDARLSAVIMRTAIDQGAVAANYLEVTDLLHSPCKVHMKNDPHELVHGVHVCDRLTKNDSIFMQR